MLRSDEEISNESEIHDQNEDGDYFAGEERRLAKSPFVINAIKEKQDGGLVQGRLGEVITKSETVAIDITAMEKLIERKSNPIK